MLGLLFKLAPSRTCFEICTIMRSGSSALHYPLGRRNGGISALCVALIRPCGDLSALCEALFLGKPCIGWQETAVFKQQYSGCHGISASHNADRPPQHPDNASHKRDDELQTPNEQTSTGKSHRTRRFVPRSHYCLRQREPNVPPHKSVVAVITMNGDDGHNTRATSRYQRIRPRRCPIDQTF
jgi:hypothetical protein